MLTFKNKYGDAKFDVILGTKGIIFQYQHRRKEKNVFPRTEMSAGIGEVHSSSGEIER